MNRSDIHRIIFQGATGMPRHFSLLSTVFFAVLILAAEVRAATPIKIACIGTSITFGYGGRSYTIPLATLLGAGYAVQNDGVSSTTVLRTGDVSYWTRGKLANVFALLPDVVIIELGTNDSKKINWADSVDFLPDLSSLVDTLSGISSHPTIWLCLPCPSWRMDSIVNGAIIVNSIIPRIRQVALAKGLSIIDLNTPLADHQELFPDNVHPNTKGSDSIAAIVYRAYASTTAIRGRNVATAKNQEMGGLTQLIDLRGRSVSWSPVCGCARICSGASRLAPGAYFVKSAAGGRDALGGKIVTR
jgi:lysophospholipase L1-like esterase